MKNSKKLYMDNEGDDLRRRFAITPLLDTEIDVGAAGWVGLTPEADHDLRKDVTSAVIARFLGSSVATAKKYLHDLEEHRPRDRLIRNLYYKHMKCYDNFYRSIPIRDGGPIGIFAFDIAMIRSRSSIELMLVTARQGFLIEPCLIARSIIEQFAYAVRVWGSEDEGLILSSRPQSLICHLKGADPYIGRAYGMLSRLAHYDPKMHHLFIGNASRRNEEGEESSSVLSRSWKFKIVSLAWVFFLLSLKFKVFRKFYGGNETFSCLKPINHSIRSDFDKFFSGVDFPAIQKIRAIL